ncbi:16S rRNA processing protein RimM [Tistlia consotensis]|uniref:Ribosome maturation factor RimM n=1 Tax=Tistlia consotensis USBA 355 TaxID=560819 RepID=A0A1Y6BGL6_9PROT|nr:ribosome maturation factor RimM [Tistlia consotensis]SMF09888.1 16S rRNA processing protein RimM [Tistlia consotensis USBA 355]SNR34181.1 16S rRNA processing protein RimM [Tistlia consotensis]
MARERLCLGAIAGAHGVRGLVKLKSFTEVPESVAAYGPLTDESGSRTFRLAVKGRVKDLLLAAIEGVEDRDAAQALRGTRLYVERDRLPSPEDPEEFYIADLVGLAVETAAGERLGRVSDVADHGAGAILEVTPETGPVFDLPFVRAVVPTVDLAGGRLIVEPPAETAGEAEADASGEGADDGRE